MTPKRRSGRLLTAASLGLASIAACAGAAPTGSAQAAWTPDPDADPAARAPAQKLPADAGPPQTSGPDAAPRCPYGALEDPHRGFVRCLLPDERDAGWLPPPPQGDVPPAEPPRAEPPGDAGPRGAAPPSVEIGAPEFANGKVTRVERSRWGKASADLARCVADHGGLVADTGSVKVQFLVRNRVVGPRASRSSPPRGGRRGLRLRPPPAPQQTHRRPRRRRGGRDSDHHLQARKMTPRP